MAKSTITKTPTNTIQASRPGRKPDPSRDRAILDAAIEVLIETGYVGMTMDMVARKARAGKATVYRRWRSKSELILEAITRMQKTHLLAPEQLPDTGNLRSDLLALFTPKDDHVAQRQLKVMAAIASVIAYNRDFAQIGDVAIIKPWADACSLVIKKAVANHQVTAKNADIPALSRVIPSMAITRALIQNHPTDSQFLTDLIDGVILPALNKT